MLLAKHRPARHVGTLFVVLVDLLVAAIGAGSIADAVEAPPCRSKESSTPCPAILTVVFSEWPHAKPKVATH